MKPPTHLSIFIAVLLSFSLSLGLENSSGNLESKKAPKNTAIIPVDKLQNDFYNWHERHDEILKLIKIRKPNLVFIGDSITHMFGGEPVSTIARGKAVWNKYYGHRNAINMGFGWDRIQNVLWRLENGALDEISPKVVVLLIGTNNTTGTKKARVNTPSEILEGVEVVCEKIHQKLPESKILVLSVLPRSNRPVKLISEINKRLLSLDKKSYVSFLNLWEAFADENGLPKKELMHDKVHPNAKGYEVWAETMEPVLGDLLGDKKVTP